MKINCYIPARLGSQRVPKKNLRLIAGKPLIAYAIEAAKASQIFNEIYVNSEADILGQIAFDWGVKFYKRPAALASSITVNDEFAYDFALNTQGDIFVQLLPTSPLITAEEINGFVAAMVKGEWDTLVSVVNHQIASLHQSKEINFSRMERHKSSQGMTPVQSYASVLMAWRYVSFLAHMKKYNFAYHGADGKTGYYVLKGLSSIDIDHEEDFNLAEVAIQYNNNQARYKKEYYQPKQLGGGNEVCGE